MRVLIVNAHDRGGGAERCVRDLVRSLRDRGHTALLAVGHRSVAAEGTIPLTVQGRAPGGGSLPDRADGLARRLRLSTRTRERLRTLAGNPGNTARSLVGRDDFVYPTLECLDPILREHAIDVVHLHNLHDRYFDLRALPGLCARLPVVLTPHDAWLTTGHCAHSFDCERWTRGCGRCPYLGTPPAIRRDATARNLSFRAGIFRSSSLHLVAPSRWLLDRFERSVARPGLRSARVIHNGIDTDVFAPGDRDRARRELGLPPDRTILLFAANLAGANPFKDYASLSAALERLGRRPRERPILLVMLGGDAGGSSPEIRGVETASLPFVHDDAQLVRYIRAADIFVHPSRADTFPYTVLESMACGTPVIASRVGGIPEQITHEHDGLLVEPGDAASLAGAIDRLAHDAGLRRRLGERGVCAVRDRFALSGAVDAYEALYRETTGAPLAAAGSPPAAPASPASGVSARAPA